jgi:23S rRNA pseudouridine1911/1915/1917 synthase
VPLKSLNEINSNRSGERLDVLLVRLGFAPSRRRARQLIDAGKVAVNGRQIGKGELVAEGDDVRVAQVPPAGLQPNPKIKIDVLFEDESVIVVNKPGLIPCHPLGEEEQNTVMNAMAAAYPESSKAGDKPLEGGLIHRLDNGTSGALIIARDYAAFMAMRSSIRRGEFSRRYLALCVGQLDGPIEIATPIAHHPKNRRKMITMPASAAASTQAARPAATVVEALRQYSGLTLVEARPRTGRRHQVRVHLASVGHPLAGDALYGGPNFPGLAAGRFWLHLSEVAFDSPSSGYVTVEAPTPPDLDAVLSAL